MVLAFFHLSGFANRLRLRRIAMCVLHVGIGMSTCEGQVETELDCKEPPLAFRTDIRSTDAWEMAWEARWPDVSSALEAWRNDQFQLLVKMWKQAAPSLQGLKREALDAGMPESAAYLIWWSTLKNPFDTESGMREAKGFDHALLSLQAEDAMAWGHAQSQSSLSLAEWAGAMRTGLRLFENFDLPEVHVVREGETVYSIARTWNVSPHCLSAKNDVWDDIQPGMTLLIPHPLD
ncbi:MAG: LysM peptidoglycan-binding domain-containing protein [Bacteroidota bacterium]|nr:LysM peptidoglycan-binding domain-containing protein [Bacteroidota bacterium]